MSPENFVRSVIGTAAPIIAPQAPMTEPAIVLLTAIAGQESGWLARLQNGGPARSYWQFERGGGVAEVFQKTPKQLQAVCGALDIPYDPATVFEAMAWNDTLACTMARFLLWQDPAPLPALGDSAAAWSYYYRNWRPGAPHPDAWLANYAKALAAVRS